MKQLAIGVVFVVSAASAQDFGVQGHVQNIVEQPFVEMMQERVSSQTNIAKLKQEMQERARASLDMPTPVSGVLKAKEDRVFWHDPSYVVEEDIILPCGRILHAAGSSVNPLDYADLERDLLFLDGGDARQVQWLKEQMQQQSDVQKIVILVGGSPLRLQKEIGQKIYFDQNGELTSKFGIKHVPARLQQDGKFLKIEEIKLG